MTWNVESWATLKGDSSKAVKLFVRLPEAPGPNERADLRAQAMGLFRRTYGEWANDLGEKVVEMVEVASGPSSTSTPPTSGQQTL